MTEADNRHPQQHPDQGWQRLPQGGEYESEATAFVQLPEGFTTGAYGAGYGTPGQDPLAAPGHGYTPPASFAQHTAAPSVPGAGTDPAATGQWTMPFADPSAGYADPSAGYGGTARAGHSTAHRNPSAGYQAGAPEAAQPWGGEQVDWPVAGSAEATGAAWTVPAADDALEESGEYLVGDDRRTGHGGAALYEDGGYGGYGAAPHGAAGQPGGTGHWNFAAGLNATSGAAGDTGGAGERFAAPAVDPYPAEPTPTTGTGGATGHWSLPADALAQWPPAPPQEETAAHQEAAADAPASGATVGWTIPAADGEQPDTSGEFMIDPAAVPAAPAAADAPAGHDTPAEHPAPVEPAAPAGAVDVPGAAEAAAAPEAPAEAPHPAADPGPTGPTGPADAEGAPEASEASEVPEPAGPVLAVAEAHPAAAPGDPEGPDAHDEHPAISYVLRVNGVDRPVTDAWIGESLLYVLRERLGLAGAKDGCSQGECGACSVQVDGRLVASCLVPAATTAGSEVRTVEGLAQHGVPSDVQRALAASGAVQCGFCVPGMAMTVHDLLEGNHAPTELETRKALCGNLCRCSGYRGVLDAVADVVKARAEAAEVAPETPAETARIPHQAGPADPTEGAPHRDPQPGGTG
ncbi:(2Fe-2S)-binding protein [Streptomyces sp. GS7]|uniref:(2Fe-2S)-binding protein n=1 Tax=Streptomyces sp. GS7 TaxID=2692234 RepID=UPI001318A990|nr:(2Fe-2S)-binding protein [Streptomyces sp. GS7]QHC20844.1 2Fe-2S iron-sulfur cluster binding domain-containing protein [Streptomyces sp. GS7]